MVYYQRKFNKYHNVRQTYNGYTYMSKFEAEYAMDLDLRLKAKDIKGWDRQFKVSLDVNGYHITNYYIDFIVYENDKSITLVEVKGMETETWRLKRKLLEAVYLPEHPECKYIVIKR